MKKIGLIGLAVCIGGIVLFIISMALPPTMVPGYGGVSFPHTSALPKFCRTLGLIMLIGGGIPWTIYSIQLRQKAQENTIQRGVEKALEAKKDKEE